MDNLQEEIEDKIIDCINSGVAGRLIILKPEEKGFEDYLGVERRGKYNEGAIYFKVNGLVGPTEKKSFIKDFLQSDFIANESVYLLFVYFDEIRQKVGDYVWLIPSLQFRDNAKIVKLEGAKKLLRFEVPLDLKNRNQYSGFAVKTENLGKIILNILEKGTEFNFNKGVPQEEKIINLENLKEFLIEARLNTYATGAIGVDNPRLLASTQLQFERGTYFYRDIFFSGNKNFIGQEIVYINEKPVWGMNYIGSQIGKPETDFLKESLLRLSDKCRLGSICEYKKRDFKYQDNGQGNIEKFSGQEEIFYNEKNVYKLNYHGGLI